MTPKTIQIFLPNGDPRGLRVAEITTSIVRVIEVPRSLLGDFLKMPEAQQVGVYFLVGSSENDGRPLLYVGQSGSLGQRLASHNQTKDFWNRAIAVASLTNNLTQTHVAFIEWISMQEAAKAGRYQLENGNEGSRPFTPPPLEADCHEVFAVARTLIATLGFPFFDPVVEHRPARKAVKYYCRSSGADAVGEYTPEGFVVLKGSRARVANVESIKGTRDERFRSKLVSDGVMVEQAGAYVFTRDHIFGSPSMAAVAVTGRTANGWVEWKTQDGRTLDEVERRPLSGAAV